MLAEISIFVSSKLYLQSPYNAIWCNIQFVKHLTICVTSFTQYMYNQKRFPLINQLEPSCSFSCRLKQCYSYESTILKEVTIS